MLENKMRSRFSYWIYQKQARFDTLFSSSLYYERDNFVPKNPRSRFSRNCCSTDRGAIIIDDSDDGQGRGVLVNKQNYDFYDARGGLETRKT